MSALGQKPVEGEVVAIDNIEIAHWRTVRWGRTSGAHKTSKKARNFVSA